MTLWLTNLPRMKSYTLGGGWCWLEVNLLAIHPSSHSDRYYSIISYTHGRYILRPSNTLSGAQANFLNTDPLVSRRWLMKDALVSCKFGRLIHTPVAFKVNQKRNLTTYHGTPALLYYQPTTTSCGPICPWWGRRWQLLPIDRRSWRQTS